MPSQVLSFGTEDWTVTTPDDIKVTQDSNGLKVAIDYDKFSLLHGNTHGIDEITFTPKVPNVASFTGFKSAVEWDVTNALSVPIAGFDLSIINNTPPPANMLDTANPTGHPSNYAHLHNNSAVTGSGAPFAPETVTTFLPFHQPDPAGLAQTVNKDTPPPAELVATGKLAPGQMVTGKTATMHSEEVANVDNGFVVTFFPISEPATSPPTISGLPASEDGSPGRITPFGVVTVTDSNTLPIEAATITIKDSTGALSDSIGSLTAPPLVPLGTPGLTHTGVGTYDLDAALPIDLTTALHGLNLDVNGPLTLTLTVKDLEEGNQQSSASTSITQTTPTKPPNNPPDHPQNPPDNPPSNPSDNPDNPPDNSPHPHDTPNNPSPPDQMPPDQPDDSAPPPDDSVPPPDDSMSSPPDDSVPPPDDSMSSPPDDSAPPVDDSTVTDNSMNFMTDPNAPPPDDTTSPAMAMTQNDFMPAMTNAAMMSATQSVGSGHLLDVLGLPNYAVFHDPHGG